MPKYRKKPIEIEAFRLGIHPIPDWFMNRISDNTIRTYGAYRQLERAEISTLEGIMTAVRGDYIIQGVAGEIYPCKADIFLASYDPVEQKD